MLSSKTWRNVRRIASITTLQKASVISGLERRIFKRNVIVKAYPFHLEILDGTTLLARHPRCYEREQDLFGADGVCSP